MSVITPPTVGLNMTLNGDIQISNSGNADLGTGSIYLTDAASQLYIGGSTNLQTTLITTNNGAFNVTGTNGITFTPTGAISMTSNTTGNLFTTTVGTITLSSTNVTGQTIVSSAGAGPSSVLLNATNTTSGQISLTSAGTSTSVPAINLLASGATGSGILISSASGTTTTKSITLTATDTTNGTVLISSSGNFAASNPAISLTATNSTSGQILMTSASNSTTVPAIVISGTSSTGAGISITSAGPGISSSSISISATNATSGAVTVSAAGTSATALSLTASAGGIAATAVGLINITTTSTSSGITIATGTAGVPVVIGTSTSLTTIAGNLLVQGTTTQTQSTNTLVFDNVITVSAGPSAIGADGGLAVRRSQAPGAAITGDVVAQPAPIQESGAFQAGSTTSAVVLSAFASVTNNFYNGWWITITSGTGINQQRRIKSYVASTKIATLYVVADNTTTPYFNDGLVLVTAPAAADTYQLFAESYMCMSFNETGNNFQYVSSSVDPGTGVIAPVQYAPAKHGSTIIQPRVYNNASFSASASANIVVTIIGHGLTVGSKIRTSNSTDAGITAAVYTVSASATNTFTFVNGSAITSTGTSSITISMLDTSILYVNKIALQDAGYGSLSIPGLPTVTSIAILKVSNTLGAGVSLSPYIGNSGSYYVKVADASAGGANAVFAISSSGATTGSVSEISQNKGSSGQKLACSWLSSASPVLYQNSAGVGGGNYTYTVTII